MNYTYSDIAKMIDHALLVPATPAAELDAGCRACAEWGVASVCVMPFYARRCAEILRGSGVKPSTVIGFPHGVQATEIKVAEALRALGDGCEELDAVVNISQVVSGEWDYVRRELGELAEVTHAAGRKIKVIFETCYLNENQKIRLCEIGTELGVDWVKTSTGFGGGGATEQDVKLMLAHVGKGVQVKASGGVRDLDTLLRFRELGVTRIGTSKTREILDECCAQLGLGVRTAAAASVKTTDY